MKNDYETLEDFFPSNYLKAVDLDNKDVVVTISHVEHELFDDQNNKQRMKAVVHFRDTDLKPLICNKTNFQRIAMISGGGCSTWPGTEICLYSEMVDYMGTVGLGLRVKSPPRTIATPEAPAADGPVAEVRS